MGEFTGKVAVVTGTSGIGRACALALASEGASVIALGIDEAANAGLRELAGETEIDVRKADVADPAQVEAVFKAVAERFGGLDVIVNSAAVHPYGTVVSTESEAFLRAYAVNVGSIHLTGKFGIPLMERRRGGAIINVASVQGHACQQNVAAYVATKGAIHALTRAMALDHAVARIRVNSISPGSVRTPILELAARTFDGEGADIEDVFKRFGAAHPIGRIGEPEEVARLATFLASERSGFMTGADYVIDGGLLAGLAVR